MPSVTRDNSSNQVVVSYPTRETQQTITVAECRLIHNMVHDKVRAIKFIREQYNMGLYEAKMIVDTVHSQAPV